MRKIRVGFSKPRDKWFPIFSWAIKLYERTPYSHVYFRFETSEGMLCYQASGTAINMIGENKFYKSIFVVEEYEFDLSDDAWRKFKSFCFKHVGDDYALMGVFGVLIADALGLKTNPFDGGPVKQYCAELVTRCFEDMGFKLNLDADRVKLKQVNEFIQQLATRRVS